MNKRLMVTLSAGEWDGIQHRPHHFMRKCKRDGWEVVYVEPGATLISPLKDKRVLTRWKNWTKGLRKTEDGIYLLSPPPYLPFGNKNRLINKLNQWLLSKTIKKQLKKLTYDKLDFYSFLPNSIDLIKYFDIDKVIYDCVDEHASFSGLINEDVVHGMEKELTEVSDYRFATAKELIENRKMWGKEYQLVPNGAEFEHFIKVDDEELDIPEEIKNINGKIIGFVGGIGDWIDLELIEKTARKMQNYQFVLIGPANTSVENLKMLKNVHLLGSKSYFKLPNYIQQFDVCLIPFKINKLTLSVNPIKMYEYLTSGKPIVSTPLPEVLEYKEVIGIANNEVELEKKIIELLENDTNEKKKARQKVGKENSWEARWQKIYNQIKD
jgi:glycosyltransferase involved in cell wall biosynthesis